MFTESKKIRIVTIIFNTEIKGYEIPAFRAAITEKAGRECIYFHHHLDDGYLYRYPLIQYKTINKKAAIVCIEKGVDEIHRFFQKPDWSIFIGDKKLELKVDKLFLNRFNMQVWNTMFSYKIVKWLGLNQKNYKEFENIESASEKINFLENILKANILAMAKGLEWTVGKPIELVITEYNEPQPVVFKKQKLLGFDLKFKTNVFLPNFIGLGKAVSHGFGIVKQLKNNK